MTTMEVSPADRRHRGYVGFLAFVLALLTAANHADEAAERHARVLSARNDSARDTRTADSATAGSPLPTFQFPGARPAPAAHEFTSLACRAPPPAG